MEIHRRSVLSGLAGMAALPFLPILSKPVLADDGFIELTASESSVSIFPSKPESQLWLYNSSTPGPELRVRKGDRVRVRFKNLLPEPTSIHWHGIRIVNDMDGVAGLTQDAVLPGESFEYDFVAPDAGTYWYHAHNKSWNQVARGLYGTLIVEDEEQVFKRENDITLVVDDWRLNQDGVLDLGSIGSFMDWSHGGRLGNYLTVNGQSRPELKLKTGEAYRVRFINVSNARVLELDPNAFGAEILGYDGQALPEPAKLTYEPLLVGPAQRVDFLLVPKAASQIKLEELSGTRPFHFATFTVEGENESSTQLVKVPANFLPEPELQSATVVSLKMTGGAMAPLGDAVYNGQKLEGDLFRETQQVWAFNGVANLSDKPLFRVRHGETIIVETDNQTAFLHAMHVHGHHFRVVDRSESEVDEGMPWRDTFLVGPEQITKIAFVADNPGKWLLHCHMLEHAAAGMNTWFEVL